MVPVEHLLIFGDVHNIVLSWMRPAVALTSKFFLSDEREDVEMPLHIIDGRPVRQRKLYFSDVDKCPQMTEGIHGVGPTGDRWDGQRILDTWYKLCKFVVCWSLTSLCHSNGHIETMPAREINPFTALTRIRTQVSQDTMIDEQSQRVDTTTH